MCVSVFPLCGPRGPVWLNSELWAAELISSAEQGEEREMMKNVSSSSGSSLALVFEVCHVMSCRLSLGLL